MLIQTYTLVSAQKFLRKQEQETVPNLYVKEE